MSLIEKIIYVADLIEESRDYDGVDILRREIEKDFEKGFVLCLEEVYKHLLKQAKPIHYLTKKAYDYYVCKK